MSVFITLGPRKACKMSLVTRVHIVNGAVDKRIICFSVKEVIHFLAIFFFWGGGIKISNENLFYIIFINFVLIKTKIHVDSKEYGRSSSTMHSYMCSSCDLTFLGRFFYVTCSISP